MDPEYRFVLTGKTAILFSKNDVEEQDRLRAWIENPDNAKFSKKGDDPAPQRR
jgi:hypothetical protein